jgi:flagellar biosynthesis protein FliP
MGTESHDPAALVQALTEGAMIDNLSPPLKIALFLGALTFLSTALVSLTAFTRVVIVLSFVRRALTTQEIPPNPVVMAMAMFLTIFIMGPTFQKILDRSVVPFMTGGMPTSAAVLEGTAIMHDFMLRQTRKSDLSVMLQVADVPSPNTPRDTPLRVLIPAFMISELKTAFIMGFFIYVPFLLIDLVVSTVLMSLGMMMVPPVMISLPFKLLLFVLVDGWQLVAKTLSVSFS